MGIWLVGILIPSKAAVGIQVLRKVFQEFPVMPRIKFKFPSMSPEVPSAVWILPTGPASFVLSAPYSPPRTLLSLP